MVDWQSAETEFEALPETGTEYEAREALGEWIDHHGRCARMERADPGEKTFTTPEVLAFFLDPAREGSNPGRRTVERWVGLWKRSEAIVSVARGRFRLVLPPTANVPPITANGIGLTAATAGGLQSPAGGGTADLRETQEMAS